MPQLKVIASDAKRSSSKSADAAPATSAVPAPAGKMQKVPKGQQTRAAILDAALELAAQEGLDGVSLGMLAYRLGMSKSGVFAHFGSREELQCSVVREYHERFEREIFHPALQAERGLPRLVHMVTGWMRSTASEQESSRLYGSLYISGAVEFDDRPGDVREALEFSVTTWMAAMRRVIAQCQSEGQLQGGVSPDQILFEVHGLILALHYEVRFLHGPQALAHACDGFAGLLARHATDPAQVHALVDAVLRVHVLPAAQD
ncbi:TetR/AcrR family transcriptional regulator [Comamonas humi]